MLTDTAIRAAKPKAKAYKLSDSGGLHLFITPQGSRLWRLKYRVEGTEKLLSFGAYPYISLSQAREKCDEAKKAMAAGIDPGAKRKAEKIAITDSFEGVRPQTRVASML